MKFREIFFPAHAVERNSRKDRDCSAEERTTENTKIAGKDFQNKRNYEKSTVSKLCPDLKSSRTASAKTAPNAGRDSRKRLLCVSAFFEIYNILRRVLKIFAVFKTFAPFCKIQHNLIFCYIYFTGDSRFLQTFRQTCMNFFHNFAACHGF